MHIRPLRLLWPALAVAAWIGGLRAETACFYGYEGFEENVRHVNLDRCPGKELAPEEGFCRMALQGDEALIYEFRHLDGAPCLVRIDRYGFNDFVARFGANYPKP
ncbi:hypothetical protein QWZ14_26280 [Paeniroseomonas aquatica]|uniref:Uncharacterized protein n=1 Tax=Paeniroseomonas aquatica TaxID=373043 RepID=A0ABT8ADW7_9PROT|nr:hypothetical protein [Paeniroseomonas aquatica]MDN3567903.1 hypothetical protein [Paeniroseomonas aquatica]